MTSEELAQGKGLFNYHCSTCHALDAKGDIGPDIRGKSVEEIKQAIAEVDFMQGFQDEFSDKELRLISGYLQQI